MLICSNLYLNHVKVHFSSVFYEYITRPCLAQVSRHPVAPLRPSFDYGCSYSDPSLSLSSIYFLLHPAACISFIWLSTERSYAMLSLQFIWSIEIWSRASTEYARLDRKKRIQWCDMFPLFMHIIFVLLVGWLFLALLHLLAAMARFLHILCWSIWTWLPSILILLLNIFFARETINKSHN